MDFTYTPAQVDLQRRAAAYAELLFPHEEAVELSGGLLADEIQRELEQAHATTGSGR